MTEKITYVEIVTALAEKVMGWRIVPHGHFRSRWLKLSESDVGKTIIEMDSRLYLLTAPNSAPNEWNPLASIADAWMVVERMYELGWSYEALRLNRKCRNPVVKFEPKAIFQRDLYPFTACAYEPTITRAICVAALKAVGK